MEALGAIKDKRAVEPLTALLNDDNENIKEKVVEALGAIKDERAVEPLTALLNDDNENIKEKVVEALGAIKDERAVEPLIRELKNEKGDIKICIIKALERIKGSIAIDSLFPVLLDESEIISRNAAKAIFNIGYPIRFHHNRKSPPELDAGQLYKIESKMFELFTEIHELTENRKKEEVFKDYKDIINQCLIIRSVSSYGGRNDLDSATTIESTSYSYIIGDQGVKKLCGLKTQISSNILYILLLLSRDPKVQCDWNSQESGGIEYRELDLSPKRQMIKNELLKRNKPLFDPYVFQDEKAWKINS